MRVYHVLRRERLTDTTETEEDVLLVPERFSWAAFFLGPFWFLWHGAWPLAAALGVAWLGMLALPPLQGGVLSFLLSLLVGLEGQAWRRWYLRWRGYEEVDVVLAHDADEALALALGHLDNRPETA